MTLALLILTLALSPPPPADHPRDFFLQLRATKAAPPEGTTAAALLRELYLHLGDPDPALRDEASYDLTVAWINEKELVSIEDRRALVAQLLPNLRRGIGESGNDGVLLRSFSALMLSLLTADNLKHPFLDQAQFDVLLGAGLDYLRDEKDLRPYDQNKGWYHATAHTADLLKFLARSSKLLPSDHPRLLQGIAAKITQLNRLSFDYGEDERLAAALFSLIKRDDFDPQLLDPFLETVSRPGRAAFQNGRFDPVQFVADRNATHMLTALFAMLSTVEKPSPAVSAVKEKLLKRLF